MTSVAFAPRHVDSLIKVAGWCSKHATRAFAKRSKYSTARVLAVMRSSGELARIYSPHARRSHFPKGDFLFACHPVFLPRSPHSFDSAMPFGPAAWLGPTCDVQLHSRVGPPLQKGPPT